MGTEKIKAYVLASSDKETCILEVANSLKGRPELDFAYVYGSFIDPGPFRDMDIALFVKSGQIPERIHEYEADIERTLSQQLKVPFPIEARIANHASIPFLYSVIQGRLVMDRAPACRIEFVTDVIARYMDIAPVLRHHAREAFSDDVQP